MFLEYINTENLVKNYDVGQKSTTPEQLQQLNNLDRLNTQVKMCEWFYVRFEGSIPASALALALACLSYLSDGNSVQPSVGDFVTAIFTLPYGITQLVNAAVGYYAVHQLNNMNIPSNIAAEEG